MIARADRNGFPGCFRFADCEKAVAKLDLSQWAIVFIERGWESICGERARQATAIGKRIAIRDLATTRDGRFC